MTEGIVTAIFYLTTLFGIAATAAYAVTFYTTTYNELYFADESAYDDTDLPYTLAIVECALAASTLMVGLLGFSSPGRPSKGKLLVAGLFLGAGVVLTGTFSVVRAWNLGIFGDDMDHTCSDASVTGCPTARYEASHDVDIRFRDPSGGECQFWFWDQLPSRLELAAACEDSSDGLCQPQIDTTIENFMDWTQAKSYGWRDDPADIRSAVLNGSLATIDKKHNMKLLLQTQAEYATIIQRPLTTQPSIAYCWYWGCSQVCQPQRFLVNRWWLLSSLTMLVIYLVSGIMTLVVYRSHAKSVDAAVPVVDVEAVSGFQVPEMGRRKRRLVSNPSGLMF